MPTLDRIAKTIVGPNETHEFGPAKLHELQDLKWGRLKSQEQAHFLRSARFLQALFESEKQSSWVVTNGDDTKARMIDQPQFEGDAFTCVSWTDDLEQAMWFARREDAERFAADDEDAWHIRTVFDVRSMWGPPPAAGTPSVPGNAPPVRAAGEGGANIAPPARAPVPALTPADARSTQHLLFLLRGFAIQNATGWKIGSNDNDHPIWKDLAQELDQYDLNYYPTSGPDYTFIQPGNRVQHQVLLEEFTEKGGDVADSQSI